MSYQDLPLMQKTLVEWKYRLKYGFELKEYEIKAGGDGVTIIVSCTIAVQNGSVHKVSIPNQTFVTKAISLSDKDENDRLLKFLDSFDSDIHTQAKFVVDNAGGGIR